MLQRTRTTHDDRSNYLVTLRNSIAETETVSGEAPARKHDSHVGIGADSAVIITRDTRARVIPAPRPNNSQRKKVNATIISIEEFSVVCEVDVQQGNNIRVALPKTFFPDDIIYGTPISISVEEGVSGVRKPVISLRPIDGEALRRENDEIQELTNNF